MTYHELVAKVKSVFEKADAHEITEHVAVQINVEGEAEGIFYLEVADGSVKVEPYDYRDRDLLIITSSATLVEIAEGMITGAEAAESGRLRAEGNFEKAGLLRAIDIQKAEPVEEAVVESAEKEEELPKAEEVEEEPVADSTETVEKVEEEEEEKPVTESAEEVEEVEEVEEEPVADSTETAEEVEEEKADEPPKAEQSAKTPGGRQISKKKRKKWKKKKTC